MFKKIKDVFALPDRIEVLRKEMAEGVAESRRLGELGAQSVAQAMTLSEKVKQAFEETCSVKKSVDVLVAEQRENADAIKHSHEMLKNAEATVKKFGDSTLSEVRKEAALNQQSIQTMLQSTNEIIRGVNEDRSHIERIRGSVESTLATAKDVLQKSEDAKRQAQAMLMEVAAEKGKQALVTGEQKMLAAMALNLCATSVSKIIASGDGETMEQEYNAILNNLNLQVIPHDDALLDILRKLLDTITFFRIQEGDRRRLEARYNQRMNNLIWNSFSSVGGLFVVAGSNPWAAAAGAAIMAGSMFVGYQRKRSEADQEHEEDLWKLERSALEQLHALRASLFETAWRLSDSYRFDDAWRLTTRQIEWYNAICSEPSHVIRYKKLEQYQDDFQVYPYYWYELGVAAQNAHQEIEQSSQLSVPEKHWGGLAERHLKTFIDLDRGHSLLRQDVIGADARIRHVSLLGQSKGWAYAIENDKEDLECVKKLAVDDPELLLKAALVYAAGLRELSNVSKPSGSQKELKSLCEERAIAYFEKLVYRGNNLPISSIILSKLYLDTNKTDKYDELLQYSQSQISDAIQMVAKDGDAEERKRSLECEWNSFFHDRGVELCDLFERQFDVALKLAHPGVFNGDPVTYPQRMEDFLLKSFDEKQKNYKVDLFAFWERIRVRLNDELKYDEFVLGLEHDQLRKIANDLNNMSYEKIASCSNEFLLIKTDSKKGSALLSRYKEVDSWLRNIGNLYVRMVTELAAGEVEGARNTKDLSPADLNALLSSHIESMTFRNHLTPFSDGKLSGKKEANYFGAFDFDFSKDDSKYSKDEVAGANDRVHDLPDGCEVLFTNVGGRLIDYFIERQMCYTITGLANATKEQREKLVRIIKARYPPKETSYRYDLEGEGVFSKTVNFLGRNAKKVKDSFAGEDEYIIQITDDYIKVEYTKGKADENIRAVQLLNCRAVVRELKRLGAGGVQSNSDRERFKELTVRWLGERKREIDNAGSDEKKVKIAKHIKNELRKMCKDPDVQRLVASCLENNYNQMISNFATPTIELPQECTNQSESARCNGEIEDIGSDDVDEESERRDT